MKKLIFENIKWILDNWYGVILLISGMYLLSTKEWKLGGLYLLFSGLFLLQRTKIINLEERLVKLERK